MTHAQRSAGRGSIAYMDGVALKGKKSLEKKYV